MENSLHGKVAIVTGAGRGIGAAIAQKLGALGAKTVIVGRSKAPLEETASKIRAAGGKAEIAQCDVTDIDSVEQLAKSVGSAQILVNNAGIGELGTPLHQLSPDRWDAMMNTNLRGVYYCIRAFAPAMIKAKSGEIINISSLAGKNALPNGAAYAATKWGLNGLSYSVAEELRQYNIRVTVICPGSVQTDFSGHPGKNLDRLLQPEDVAHVVEMVVSQAQRSFASEILLRPLQRP